LIAGDYAVTDHQAHHAKNAENIGNSMNTHAFRSNENKMSDGGRGRASLGIKVWESSQKWRVQRSAVRSIAWLDALV
jgi:hypothetical protein